MYLTKRQKSIIEKISERGNYSLFDLLKENFGEYHEGILSKTFNFEYKINQLSELYFTLTDYAIVTNSLIDAKLIVIIESESLDIEIFYNDNNNNKQKFDPEIINKYQKQTIYATESLKVFIESEFKTEMELNIEKDEKYKGRTLCITIIIAIISMFLSLIIGIANLITNSKIEVIIKHSKQPIPVIINK